MTWSILARDKATGTLGAAVATRFFAVGALAVHVEGGVAALATQALINPMYAVHGMPRLRACEAPDAVIAALLAADAGRAHRQIHILDAGGRIWAQVMEAAVAPDEGPGQPGPRRRLSERLARKRHPRDSDG